MASQKELLSVKGQEKMDKLKDASWDEVGGPELDWTTADYLKKGFDAAQSVDPDKTILAKAAVKAEKGETVKESHEMDDEEMMSSEAKHSEMSSNDDEEEQMSSDMGDVEEAAETDADGFSLNLDDLVGEAEDMNVVDLGMDMEDEKAAPVEEAEETEAEGEESEDEESEDEESEDEESEDEESEDEVKKEVKDEMEEATDLWDEEKEEEDLEESRFVLSFKFDQADKLFESNSVLTEEDKRQGRVLFEAAIRDVAKQVATKLNEAYTKKFQRASALHEKKMAKHVDQYLNYVVEQWSKDNAVTLKSQIQTKLTENFMNGMKRLFEQHYIDIPPSKVNVVEALAKNVKALKQQVRVSEEKAVQLHSEMKTAVARERQALVREHRARLIAEAAGALPAAERGQFAKRAESLTFSTTKNYKKDLVALREQYFGAKPSVERPMNVPDAAPLFEEKPAAPAKKSEVDLYAEALGRFTR